MYKLILVEPDDSLPSVDREFYVIGMLGLGNAIGEGAMDEHEPPKGALVAILIYLLLVVLLWTNVYLRLWVKG